MRRLTLFLVSATLLLAPVAKAEPVTTIITTTTKKLVYTGNTWSCTVAEPVVGAGSTAGAPTPLPGLATHCVWHPLRWHWKTVKTSTHSWTTPCHPIGYVSGGQTPGSPVVIHLSDSCDGYGGPQIVKRLF